MIDTVAERYVRLGLQLGRQVEGVEAQGCYGVRPAKTDQAVFTVAHERLEELLPGSGPLADRRERWKNSMLVPADRLEHTASAVIDEARAQTLALVDSAGR